MPKPTTALEFGTEVDVINGTEIIRGLIAGISWCVPPRYDVRPNGKMSMADWLVDRDQDSIRLVPDPLPEPDHPSPVVISISRLVKRS